MPSPRARRTCRTSEAPPPYSSGAPRLQRPEAFVFPAETAVVFFRNFGCVGIEPCFKGKDLVADKAVHLLAKEQELLGKLESGKAVHYGEVKTTGGEQRKA